MSVRHGALDCKEPGCKIRVVTGTITDNTYVYDLQHHPSVTASELYNGMGIGDFYSSTIVKHSVNNGKVEHSIVSK